VYLWPSVLLGSYEKHRNPIEFVSIIINNKNPDIQPYLKNDKLKSYKDNLLKWVRASKDGPELTIGGAITSLLKCNILNWLPFSPGKCNA
jgi:hypothetical protein